MKWERRIVKAVYGETDPKRGEVRGEKDACEQGAVSQRNGPRRGRESERDIT